MRKNKRIQVVDITKKMIATLKLFLLNKDLLDFILNNINLANNPNYSATVINDNEVRIRGKKNTDSFGISFEPSIQDFDKITITTSCNENHKENVITIDYSDGEHIIINDETITKLRDTNNVILSMCSIRKKTIYRHNALSYFREYKTVINMHCNDSEMLTTLEELIIDDNANAVKKVMYVQDDVNMGDVKYYESRNYKSSPFNTVFNNNNNKSEDNNEMMESNEQTFNTFVANLKDKKILEKK